MATLTEIARRLKPHAGRGEHRSAPSLPALILMTDPVRMPDPLAAAATLPAGSAVILRHYGEPDRADLASALAALCRQRRLKLLIAGDARLGAAVGAAGVHLPEHVVADRRVWSLPQARPDWLVTAAAHSPAAITRAAAAGIDAVLVSPVFPTASYPGAPTLGALRFTAWVRNAPLPVYALGGVTPDSARRLAGSGAVGLAAIGALAGR